MRVARVSLTYRSDDRPGIGNHVYYLSKYSSLSTTIYTFKGDYPPSFLEGVDIKQGDFTYPGLSNVNYLRLLHFFLKAYFWLSREMLTSRYDIVHCHSPHFLPLLRLLSSIRKFKVLQSWHGSDAAFVLKNPLLSFLFSADAHVLVESSLSAKISKLKGRRYVSSSGVELSGIQKAIDDFQPIHFNSIANKYVCVANVRPIKNLEMLIEVMNQLRFYQPDLDISILGDLTDSKEVMKIEKMIADRNLEHHVHLLGSVTKDIVYKEILKSRALILTSLSEGMPKVVIEALALGVPVVSTDVGNVKQLIGDYGTVVGVNEISEMMIALIGLSQIDLTSKKKNTQKRIASYDWSLIARFYEEIYKSL
jgi:glycosyltransferase involved in cell wall biosynthesis